MNRRVARAPAGTNDDSDGSLGASAPFSMAVRCAMNAPTAADSQASLSADNVVELRLPPARFDCTHAENGSSDAQ